MITSRTRYDSLLSRHLHMHAVAIAFVAGCVSAASPRAARTGPALTCELRQYAVTSVAPFTERALSSKTGMNPRARGAQMFIQAQPGLTAEWLRLQLGRHIESARTAAPTADCPLDVDGAAVTVDSSGPGFLVTIRATDQDAADEILRRARLFLSSAPRVAQP